MPPKPKVTYRLRLHNDLTNNQLVIEVESEGFENTRKPNANETVNSILRYIRDRYSILVSQPKVKLNVYIVAETITGEQMLEKQMTFDVRSSIFHQFVPEIIRTKFLIKLGELDDYARYRFLEKILTPNVIHSTPGDRSRSVTPSSDGWSSGNDIPPAVETDARYSIWNSPPKSDQRLQANQSGNDHLLIKPTNIEQNHSPTQPALVDDDNMGIVIISDNSTDERIEISLDPDTPGHHGVDETADAKYVLDYQCEYPVQIVVRKKAIQEAVDNAHRYRNREVGGVLLGQIRYLPNRPVGNIEVFFTGIVQASHVESRVASLTITPESWAAIWNLVDHHTIYANKPWTVVGWYHTHPGFGIFLSAHDITIHKEHFRNSGHLALVLDPVRNETGFFCWDPEKRNIPRYRDNLIQYIDDHELKTRLELAVLPDAIIVPPQHSIR